MGKSKILFDGELYPGGIVPSTVVGSSSNDIFASGAISTTMYGGAGGDLFLLTSGDSTVTLGGGHNTVKLAWNGGASWGTVTDFGIGTNCIDLSSLSRITSGGSRWFDQSGNGSFGLEDLSFLQLNATTVVVQLRSGSITLQNAGGLDAAALADPANFDFRSPVKHKLDLGAGISRILGNDQGNLLGGTLFADNIRGGLLNDLAVASTGSDVVRLLDGDDVLDLGPGNDTGYGGRGGDVVIDGEGADLLFGGGGSNTFVFVLDSDMDTIGDFKKGKDTVTILTGGAFGVGNLIFVQVDADTVRIDTPTGDKITVNGAHGSALSVAELIPDVTTSTASGGDAFDFATGSLLQF